MPVLKTVTLGCKVNQYETQYVREGFLRLGYRDAINGERADLIVVNSCTVTAESEAKSRKIVRRMAKKNPGAKIILMGCYATRSPAEAAALPSVVEIVEDKRHLPALLERWGADCSQSHFPIKGISSFKGRHRAWVKIQDGCRSGCSYCIIPLVRPILCSRPVDEVLDEIRRLTNAGYAEIVLTGIHLGHYGIDDSNSGNNLSSLLRRIVEIDCNFRVRLSSIEAVEVAPELLDVMAEYPRKFCPHLHIPMQSGSDRILELMRRRWPVRRFIDRCLEIRDRLDRPALTTDVIVGFPSETDEDFASTCRTVEEAGFSKIHVFRFSPREGTDAAKMPNRVPQRVHQQWAAELNEISNSLTDRYIKKLNGKTLQVLIEGRLPQSPSILSGTADRYVTVEFPDNICGKHRMPQLPHTERAEYNNAAKDNFVCNDVVGTLIDVHVGGTSGVIIKGMS